MLKVTRLADYSVLILCCFDDNDRKSLSSSRIQYLTGLKSATVNKLLSILVKNKVLSATRGSKGGYSPVKTLKDISIKEIIEAVEGPVAITNCIGPNSTKCDLENSCFTKNAWGQVNKEVVRTLENIKIIDINNNTSFINA